MAPMTDAELRFAKCFEHDDPSTADLAELKRLLDEFDSQAKPLELSPEFVQVVADKSRAG
jgi:hypothetical protein